MMKEAINEISFATASGFKSKHDDFIDTISMLQFIEAWKPYPVKEEPIQQSDYNYYFGDDLETRRLEERKSTVF
ncbi:MAG: hypothetical protein LBU73_01765 [Helicobacteraceae bacterium]|nr:hypothetical protein [Helicobacteraceae bacterium]